MKPLYGCPCCDFTGEREEFARHLQAAHNGVKITRKEATALAASGADITVIEITDPEFDAEIKQIQREINFLQDQVRAFEEANGIEPDLS